MTKQPGKRGKYQPPSNDKLAELKRLAGSTEMPSGYCEQLAVFSAEYRRTNELPRTDFAKLTVAPKDQFRMFPAKCRRALSHASSDAKLVFLSLWDQHEEKRSRANGVLISSTEWFTSKLDIHNRNRICTAVLELEVRGLVRIQRGRGGNGTSHVNMFQLTAFPDCLGNPPTTDYERLGLPEMQSQTTGPKPDSAEADKVALQFNARIKARMAIIRHARRTKLSQA